MATHPIGSLATRPRPAPPGFALPVVVFGLAILLLIAAAGHLVSWLELRSARAFEVGTRAFFVAEAGLATALAQPGRPAAATLMAAIGADRASVTFERLLDLAPGESVYRVRSAGSTLWLGAPTTRSVEELAWFGDPPRVPAALVVSDSLAVTGATGLITGKDAGGCAPGDAAGALVWAPAQPPSGSGLQVDGSPPSRVLPPRISLAAVSGLRWDDLIAGHVPAPDRVHPPDPWPNPPVMAFIRLRGSPILGAAHSGSGVILAEGDLELTGGFSWRGLVLVGGSVDVTGDIRLRGALFAGLDPAHAGVFRLGAVTVDLGLDQCAVREAGVLIAPYPAPIPGTWTERF